MQINVTFRNLDHSEELRDYVEAKLQKLEKYSDGPMDVNVVLRSEKFRNNVEVVVSGDGIRAAAREVQDDMKAAIDLVSDKIERQLKKFRDKQKKRRNHSSSRKENVGATVVSDDSGGYDDSDVIIVEKMDTKPMSVDEAVEQFHIMGKNFLVFLNADTERVNVLYWRSDGSLGLIES
jgi:putative sigma-54 modulation protein